jgi:hypothetical protein
MCIPVAGVSTLAAMSKSLAQMNKSPDRGEATKKRKPPMNGYRPGVEATKTKETSR